MLLATASRMTSPAHAALVDDLARFLPRSRIVTDPLRLVAYATRASLTRLAPRVAVVDELLRPHSLARLDRRWGAVAVHAVCSLRKQGVEAKRHAVAEACAASITMPAGTGECGFAGDQVFTVPEPNARALRDLAAALPPDCAAGHATSRTCEVGLSQHGGVP